MTHHTQCPYMNDKIPELCPTSLTVQAALERVDIPHTQSYLNDLFRQYDVDKDGSVDFSEFQQYVEHRERAFKRAFRCDTLRVVHSPSTTPPYCIHGACTVLLCCVN